MSTGKSATRRSFFGRAGAALVAPLAATQALARDDAGGDLAARIAELEDVNAVRALQRAFARSVNTGSRDELAALFDDPAGAQLAQDVRSIAVETFGERDFIELGGDGTATAQSPCTVESATAIGPACTLVEMARLQGDGFVRRTEHGVLETSFVKRGGVWKIAHAVFRTA